MVHKSPNIRGPNIGSRHRLGKEAPWIYSWERQRSRDASGVTGIHGRRYSLFIIHQTSARLPPTPKKRKEQDGLTRGGNWKLLTRTLKRHHMLGIPQNVDDDAAHLMNWWTIWTTGDLFRKIQEHKVITFSTLLSLVSSPTFFNYFLRKFPLMPPVSSYVGIAPTKNQTLFEY